MGRIQVDMFEVQLGAALLLQFSSRGRTVRVLADAGIRASGYPLDHVHRKLPVAFDAFDGAAGRRRLDLVIGTHYDADHLDGLVPILADPTIEIGETWLPPVADDVDAPRGGGTDLDESRLLVRRLAGSDGRAFLAEYLRAKQSVCDQTAELEHLADQYRSARSRGTTHESTTPHETSGSEASEARGDRVREVGDAAPGGASRRNDVDAWLRVFRAHEEDAAVTLGAEAGDLSHGRAVPDDPDALAHAAAARSGVPWPDDSGLADLLQARWRAQSRDLEGAYPAAPPPSPIPSKNAYGRVPETWMKSSEGVADLDEIGGEEAGAGMSDPPSGLLPRDAAAADMADEPLPDARESATERDRMPASAADWDAANLAAVRQAAARDAISAISLAKVVDAAVARGIPIRCPIIDDGVPTAFVWRRAERRFLPGSGRGSPGPILVLLGPSRGLVLRHSERLPVGVALQRSADARIPLLGVTPSNQLSYVARFGLAGQGILLAGDTGFVDFTAEEGGYHPALLAALRPLEVVQVAHHAGNNGHFYRALLAAGYGRQRRESFLLVSHATHDPHRPSPTFGMFLDQVRPGVTSIVFTSEPDAEKVAGFLAAIHPVVGERALVGDVRAEFDGVRWTVTNHAVAV